MAEDKKKSVPAEYPPEEKFDRQAYLKEIREGLLKNLGLPEGTKPEQVTKLLEIKARLKK